MYRKATCHPVPRPYQPAGDGAAAIGLVGPTHAQVQTDTVGKLATPPVVVMPWLTVRTLPSAMPTKTPAEVKAVAVCVAVLASLACKVVGCIEKFGLG